MTTVRPLPEYDSRDARAAARPHAFRDQARQANHGAMTVKTHFSKTAASALLALMLAGCDAAPQLPQIPSIADLFTGGKKEPGSIRVNLRTVTLAMPAGANQNWPAKIELVRTEIDDLKGKELLQTDTTSWFDKERNAFQAANPKAVTHYWEVVPGTTIGPFDVTAPGKYEGILFCGVRSNPPPIRVTDGEILNLLVLDKGCTVDKPEAS